MVGMQARKRVIWAILWQMMKIRPKAPSYTLVGLFTGYKYNYHNFTVDLFGRVDNLFDKEYVGSVIVNESNGRYYEPAPGRNYGVGINIAWRFE